MIEIVESISVILLKRGLAYTSIIDLSLWIYNVHQSLNIFVLT